MTSSVASQFHLLNDFWIRIACPFLLHHGYYGEKTGAASWNNYLTKAGLEIVERGAKPVTLYFLVRKIIDKQGSGFPRLYSINYL